MSWTDKQSIQVINYLKRKYKINTLVETGTFKGINAKLHSNYFERVITCEKVDEYYKIAKERLKNRKNVILVKEDSPKFLRNLKLEEPAIYYLDAHFYDPSMPKGKGKFVILKELKALEKPPHNRNDIIVIHDFDNNLGHITYDGISLDTALLWKTHLPSNYWCYTNELASCDIVTPNSNDILQAGLDFDDDTLDNLQYAWSHPRLTYRGILYCLPTQLTKQEMRKLGLREWN